MAFPMQRNFINTTNKIQFFIIWITLSFYQRNCFQFSNLIVKFINGSYIYKLYVFWKQDQRHYRPVKAKVDFWFSICIISNLESIQWMFLEVFDHLNTRIIYTFNFEVTEMNIFQFQICYFSITTPMGSENLGSHF